MPNNPILDLVVDRSPVQKLMRVEKLRVELLELGYEIVPAKPVMSEFWRNKLAKQAAE
ncbi:hypothetical protein V1290_000030 [Bradyrhizobium sp. AZCC 1578]|uniref:hypothetical protein n=1 Tax=Bradyrhizobium sp. AZCC 1578 TaxID=3117027 RepID=UPI002FF27747